MTGAPAARPVSRTALFMVNAGASYLRFAISMAVMFVMTPFIIRHLGARDFGLWSLTFAVLGFFALVDCGFATSTVKFVAECRGAGDVDRRNRLVSTLAVVYLGLAGAAALALAALSPWYGHLFGVPGDQRARALAVLWILAMRAVVFALPLGLFQGVLFGEQRLWMINAVQVVSTLGYAAAAWFALERGAGIVGLAWVNLGAMLAEYLTYTVLCFVFVPGLRVLPRLADRSHFREMASFSVSQLLVNVAALVRLRTDPIIVTLFLPLPYVAAYAVALRIAESSLLLTKQAINAMTPLVAQVCGEGDAQKVRFMLVNAARFAFGGAVILSTPVCCLARDILRLWVGPQFEVAAPTLIVLMVAMALVVPQMVAANVLVMNGHHALSARAQVWGMALNVAVSVLLVRPLGLAGVAVGTLVATVVVDLGYSVSQACLLHGVPRRVYARRVLLAGALPGLLQAVITLGLRAQWQPHHLGAVAAISAPGAVAACALFWWCFVEPSEKHLLASKLLGRAGHASRPAQPAPEGGQG